jgi:tripartite-type tricarboxylate transporter receptor subunit TctC
MKEQKHQNLLHSLVLLSIFLSIFVFTVSANAEYPDKPITIMIAALGSASDLSTRAIAKGAEQYLGQPIIVEFKGAGRSANLAMAAIAKPDGYTLAATPDASTTVTPQLEESPFKPLRFTPIISVALAQHSALVVKSDSPWKTAKEFIDYAKKNPGKIRYTPGAIGVGMHIAMEVIAKKEGIQWVMVPTKSSAPAMTMLLGGHLDACSAGIGTWEQHVKAGTLRVLLTHGEVRSPDFPNVPTQKELGYDYVNKTIHYIVGPPGLPPDIVKKLETAFAKSKETPEFKKVLDTIKCQPINYNSKEMDRHLREMWASTEKKLKLIGLIDKPATQPE